MLFSCSIQETYIVLCDSTRSSEVILFSFFLIFQTHNLEPRDSGVFREGIGYCFIGNTKSTMAMKGAGETFDASFV